MRVGISTACFYPYYNTEDTLSIISELGFDLCEIFLETEGETDPIFCRNLKEKADALGLEISSIHAFGAAFEPFLFDRYPRRREEMEKKFRTALRAGEILGVRYYVFHGLRFAPNITYEPSMIARGMDRLVLIAKEYGIKLTWENVSWCISNDPNFIKKVKEHMKEEIGFTLDIKQAVRSFRKIEDYLNVYGKELLNVHINDSAENRPCLLPGEGEMDLGKIIKKIKTLNPNSPYIIEVYSENYKDFNDIIRAKNYLENLGG